MHCIFVIVYDELYLLKVENRSSYENFIENYTRARRFSFITSMISLWTTLAIYLSSRTDVDVDVQRNPLHRTDTYIHQGMSFGQNCDYHFFLGLIIQILGFILNKDYHYRSVSFYHELIYALETRRLHV